MIKPVINEVFPSTGILLRNKYIDSFRRAYFINKIYEAGIKNIEIGSFSKNQSFINGIYEVSSNTNNKIYKSGFADNTTMIKPYINQIIYQIYSNNNENMRIKGASINDSIKEFIKIKEISNLPIKLVIEGTNDFPYIYNNTKPNIVEVSSINNIILKTIDDITNLSLRSSSFEEVDKALYEGIYKFSSSILKVNNHVETITLIKHLQSKLGVELPVSITQLTEIKKDIEDDFNW